MSRYAPPEAGVWRHYKGQHYLVLGLAHDANADALFDQASKDKARNIQELAPLGEREVVVYVPLELDGANTGARLAVRTLSDFMAVVCRVPDCNSYGRTVGFHPDPCVLAGHATWRFVFLGQRWKGATSTWRA